MAETASDFPISRLAAWGASWARDQDVTVDEMFMTAKYVNAFWYPQQSQELAVAFKAMQGADFAAIDARELTGVKFSSGSGFKVVHQYYFRITDNRIRFKSRILVSTPCRAA